MSDEQEQNSADHPKSLPSPFAALDAIMIRNGVGVIENVHGYVKTYAMLSLVRLGLDRIPFKMNHRNLQNRITSAM